MNSITPATPAVHRSEARHPGPDGALLMLCAAAAAAIAYFASRGLPPRARIGVTLGAGAAGALIGLAFRRCCGPTRQALDPAPVQITLDGQPHIVPRALAYRSRNLRDICRTLGWTHLPFDSPTNPRGAQMALRYLETLEWQPTDVASAIDGLLKAHGLGIPCLQRKLEVYLSGAITAENADAIQAVADGAGSVLLQRQLLARAYLLPGASQAEIAARIDALPLTPPAPAPFRYLNILNLHTVTIDGYEFHPDVLAVGCPGLPAVRARAQRDPQVWRETLQSLARWLYRGALPADAAQHRPMIDCLEGSPLQAELVDQLGYLSLATARRDFSGHVGLPADCTALPPEGQPMTDLEVYAPTQLIGPLSERAFPGLQLMGLTLRPEWTVPQLQALFRHNAHLPRLSIGLCPPFTPAQLANILAPLHLLREFSIDQAVDWNQLALTAPVLERLTLHGAALLRPPSPVALRRWGFGAPVQNPGGSLTYTRGGAP